MAYLVIRHTVEDYTKFKSVFDGHAPVRRAAGSQGGMLLRGADNEIVVITKWGNMEAASAFSKDPSLREAMMKATVSGTPTIYFLDKVEDFSF
jgi:heme-degrading monooxygenase HmoA